ncbi:MAG: peptidylprolyl isomerase [Flavobacteriales bacterium]|nr:peptidylprolyl isomerase [Flavobacteriales bacterium]
MRALFTSCTILLLLSISAFKTGDEWGDGLYANIQTSKGKIVIKLEYGLVPKTVANFVGLAEGTIPNDFKKAGEPYYDGLNFHRVVADGIIQGGCPEGNGMGNPGYKFKDEFNMKLVHDRAGTVSMANSGRHTNGSQFFITHRAIPSLDHKHSVFGYVVQGLEVVNVIKEGDVMNKVTIIRVGSKAKAFKAETHFTEKDRKKAD